MADDERESKSGDDRERRRGHGGRGGYSRVGG